MRVYIAGPVSGYKDLNRPAFEMARRRLSTMGHIGVVPLDYTADIAAHPCPAYVWAASMARVLDVLASCDGIYLLDGWQDSRGARIERDMAHLLRKCIISDTV